MSLLHEIRDPIHNFIKLDTEERRIVDSRPFQRLRHIHQLAMTSLVYPGATHKRFEHSLGVMELATRIFHVITSPEKLEQARRSVPGPSELQYWRRVLRMAALFHDVGHLPFSHAAEDLLPKGWRHEHMTVALIGSPEMEELWRAVTPPLRSEDIIKIAVGPKDLRKAASGPRGAGYVFSPWEGLLAEIITSDVFGADRMDYLLRDSWHAGVAYGKFDHHRLISTLRILPSSHEGQGATEPRIGVEGGGIQAAEGLLWARYQMFSQVYLHHIRRAYDLHLADFLKAWLKDGVFSTDVDTHLRMTDNEVTAAILAASRDPDHPGHGAARAIVERRHYRRVYELDRTYFAMTPRPGLAVAAALSEHLGQEHVRHDFYTKANSADFPVLHSNGSIRSGMVLSDAVRFMPPAATDSVYVAPELREQAREFLEANLEDLLQAAASAHQET